MFKKSKKIQAIVLVALVLLTTSASCAATQTGTQEIQTRPQMEKTSGTDVYTDIRNSWAYEAISYVLDKEIMEGTSSTAFSPNEAMTVSAFTEALDKMSGEDSTEDSSAASTASTLTRAETAELLYDYVKAIGLLSEDGAASGDTAAAAVSTVTSLGLMSEKSGGAFAPDETTTRAEAATVIYRLCMLIDEANTGVTLLAKIAEKNDSIEQYSDYKSGDYETATLKGSSVTITKAGTYVISGTLKDGRIIVDAGDEDTVRLVFNNTTITSSDGPAVVVKNAGETVLSLPAGTESVLTDSSDNTYDENASGVIYSEDDLLINGTGTLTIQANYKDGISGNDDIRITQTKLVIDAVDDGVKANDSVSVNDADITVKSGGDGIKTSNSAEIGKGYIAINGGTLDITSGTEGMQAETLLYIMNGSLNINTTAAETGDANGMKAGSGIVTENGSFNIDSVGDALNSGGIILVEGGSFDISKCYEGIEGRVIEIAGGDIDLTASDDGINAGSKITISGGDIKVNATGDGIDVNGSAYMTGGNVLVIGPTNNGNGSLDYDGVFEISGGTLLTAGSSGMAAAPSSGSTQYTIANTTGEQASGTTVKLVDSSGKTIASFTPDKSYGHIVISSPDIKNGETYTLYAGSTKAGTFTVSSPVTGDTGNGVGMPGGGRMRPDGGGMRPDGGEFPEGGAPPQQ